MRDRTNLVIGGISVALALVLLSTANRYGFHRDELYFIEAGHHLAWAESSVATREHWGGGSPPSERGSWLS